MVVAASPFVLRDLQINYLWPQYSLPWNNFFGRIQPNPYYLQNQLRNITIGQIQSPISFRSRPVVATADGASVSGLTIPNWNEIDASRSVEQNSSASKVFVGPYVDISKDISGLEYQYDYTGNSLIRRAADTGKFVYLVLNLNNNDPATINFPAYVQTEDGSYSACQVGDSNDNFSTLTGQLIVHKKTSCVSLADKSYCLDDAKPLGLCAATCRYDDTSAFYYINGNRLYIAVHTDSDDDCKDCDDITSKLHISYAVTIRIVETTTPLQRAINVFTDPFAPIL